MFPGSGCKGPECCLSGLQSWPARTAQACQRIEDRPESKSRVLACIHRPGIQGLNAVGEMCWLGERSLQDCCCSIPEARIVVNELLTQLSASCPAGESHCRRNASSPDRPAHSSVVQPSAIVGCHSGEGMLRGR